MDGPGGGGPESIKDLQKKVRQMPDFQDVKSKLSAHMHVTTQALDAFQERGLLDIVAKEQNLATGIKGDEPANMRGLQPQLKLTDAEKAVEQFVASPQVQEQ